jgi:hypothetical protein
MLAKAGESDRAIRVKMVVIVFFYIHLSCLRPSAVLALLRFHFLLALTIPIISTLFLFSAETPLRREAEVGQDQPPIDT